MNSEKHTTNESIPQHQPQHKQKKLKYPTQIGEHATISGADGRRQSITAVDGWQSPPRVALLAFGEIGRRRQQLLVGAVPVQHQPRHLQAPADVDLQVAMHEPHPCRHVHHQTVKIADLAHPVGKSRWLD